MSSFKETAALPRSSAPAQPQRSRGATPRGPGGSKAFRIPDASNDSLPSTSRAVVDVQPSWERPGSTLLSQTLETAMGTAEEPPSTSGAQYGDDEDDATQLLALQRQQAQATQPGPKRCLHCQTTNTPLWRGGPLGPKTLCNACGIRHKLSKPPRPLDDGPPRGHGGSKKRRTSSAADADNPYARASTSFAARVGEDGAHASGRAARGGPPPLLSVLDACLAYDPSRPVGSLGFDRWLAQEKMGRGVRFGADDIGSIKRKRDGGAPPAAPASAFGVALSIALPGAEAVNVAAMPTLPSPA